MRSLGGGRKRQDLDVSRAAAKMLAKRVDTYKRANVQLNSSSLVSHSQQQPRCAALLEIYIPKAAHAWTDSVDSIAGVSHIAVRAYENIISPQFRAIPQNLAALRSKRFLLIPSSSFLGAPHTDPSQTHDNLTLKPLDYEL
ncbi:hypothetical protein BJ138DRAFT_1115120 [Hygrophoropsis aurantiaca]|uniref:Uncharacterized protein n=1 Tax=Hygrophoropsis aurantiaca TaxID=72124 RepID=A0ACB8A9B7_9AGAM|nr:hypothetical protein BJ138DRAFT_1115120 [Hygrophoropsis aurantiaca]